MKKSYVIIGSGPTGVVASETLRKLDSEAEIVMLNGESEKPYSRMAIPYLLRGDIHQSGTHLRKNNDHYQDKGIQILQTSAHSVNVKERIVETDEGQKLKYDKLLVCTGSRPMKLPISGMSHPNVINCWSLSDVEKMTLLAKQGAQVVLIGAGFIGCIILEALVSLGLKVNVVEMGDRMVPRMLDDTCGSLLEKWCKGKGVKVFTGTQVQEIDVRGEQLVVKMDNQQPIVSDFVISAVGVRGNTEILESIGAKIQDNAILIDKNMKTSIDHIYAAGDVACGVDFSTGGYSVQAIQPTAVDHARVAAHNMHRHGSIAHRGSVLMNVLDTMGLISVSYGQWQGVANGESSLVEDRDRYRYLNLQFAEDRLVGANSLGFTQHVGVLRGLIQGRFPLGKWKKRLVQDPTRVMEAYLAVTQGV